MGVIVWDVLETGCMGGCDAACPFIVDNVCGLGGIIPNLAAAGGERGFESSFFVVLFVVFFLGCMANRRSENMWFDLLIREDETNVTGFDN